MTSTENENQNVFDFYGETSESNTETTSSYTSVFDSVKEAYVPYYPPQVENVVEKTTNICYNK